MPASVNSDDTSVKPEESGIDVLALKELAKRSLLEALNSVNGSKTLVLDPSLVGPLGLVTDVAFLKQNGLDKMFWLESGPLNAPTPNIVYLCRPKIKYAKIIADHIRKHTAAGDKHIYTLILTPRTSTLISQVLEEEGVLGEITILPYNLQFIPLEDDVISLEHENAFKEIWLDGDETALYNSAQALLTLQRLYGLFPRILGKGEHAERLARLLIRLNAQQITTPGLPVSQGVSEKIDSLIIVERRADMVTPMLTQLTYEGLIDELVGVSNTYVELPANIVSPPSQANTSGDTTSQALNTTPVQAEKKKKYQLSSATDPLFKELRDVNFALTHLEDLVAEGADRRTILRMMVLASVVSGGIKVKQLESLKRVFLQTYGYELLPTLLSLESLQLLQSNPLPPSQAHLPSMKLPFTALRKQLRLLIEESEGGTDAMPNDISYVYSGYAPLSIRLVQCVAQMNAVLASFNASDSGKGKGKGKDVSQASEMPKMNAHPIVGWKGFEDVINTIPGPTVDITQTGIESKAQGPSLFPKEQSTTTVVFFLGGCTFTEITAIRWMAKRTRGRRFMIATTGVVSGNSLIESLLPAAKPKTAKVAGGSS
ncbi:hypothetical protein FRC18_012211 [Serendipita sp. 400]|nr:hypothetical protein FRC18_012211 [Serendipita sp. 400]